MRISIFLILIPLFIFSCQNTETEIKEKKRAVTDTIVEKKIDTAVTIYLTFDDGPYITTPSVDSLLTALKIKPNYAEAINNRGAAFQELKQKDEALKSYDMAIAMQPD